MAAQQHSRPFARHADSATESIWPNAGRIAHLQPSSLIWIKHEPRRIRAVACLLHEVGGVQIFVGRFGTKLFALI
jgi:hypothetical protein